MEVVLIIGGVIIFVLILMSAIWYFDKKRTEAIEALAESLGLEFVGEVPTESLGEVASFPLFQSGHSRRVRNLLQGETEIARIQIFDYQYTVGSGKNKSTCLQTVVTMVSDQIQAPEFHVSPEGFFTRFTHWFGAHDIDFDTHQDFSDSYQLRGPNEQAIRDFFDQTLMDYFCEQKGLSLSVKPGELVYYRSRSSLRPEDWKDLMGEGFSAYQAVLSRSERGH